MRILLTDPNETSRRQASHRLVSIPGVAVVGTAADLTQTFDFVEHRPPNVVLLEQGLAKHAGFETMETLFRCLSVRHMFYKSRAAPRGRSTPESSTSRTTVLDLDADDMTLAAQIRSGLQTPRPQAPTAQAGLFRSTQHGGRQKIVLIGSSTGGVDALVRVLGSFPIDCPPTLVVQHTGASFSAGLSRLLNQRIEPEVREARDGETPQRGTVLIAPSSDEHLILDVKQGVRCKLVAQSPESGHRPSVDVLFKSAVPIASRVIGVLLTGMGKDGAEGLLSLRRAGARTIGQDKATSVVYGMPGYASKIGAVEKELPLQSIGAAILDRLQGVRA